MQTTRDRLSGRRCRRVGMAFTDTLVAETDAHVVLVDRGHAPGGHWTSAYPFVRLHQPSAYYGVNSRRPGQRHHRPCRLERGPLRAGHRGRSVCLLRPGHAPWPTAQRASVLLSDDGIPWRSRFRTLAGDDYTIDVRRRVVDTTYLKTVVPSMRPPPYHVGDGVDCVAPNDLPASAPGHQRFVIVGAGKTGIDACLWLLRNDIAPDRLTWIMPRDAWLHGSGQYPTRPAISAAFSNRFRCTL